MPRSKFLASGELSEETIQKTVIEWINKHPSLKNLVMHFPNEGKRTYRFGKTLQEMGMRRGVSDLFVAMGRHGFHGAWIELKSADGVISLFQKKFLEDMQEQNYFTAVCWSIDEAISMIEWYCML